MTPRAAGDSTGSWWQMECPYPPPTLPLLGHSVVGSPGAAILGNGQVPKLLPSPQVPAAARWL